MAADKEIRPGKEAKQAATDILRWIKNGSGDMLDLVPLLNNLFAAAYHQGFHDSLKELQSRIDKKPAQT